MSIVAQIVTSQNDLKEVLAFLGANNLPYQDISLSESVFVKYHDSTGQMVGSGGLEFYDKYALLRSVSVHAGMRGRAVGTFIVNDLLGRATQHGTQQVYLLTETAGDFFLRLGFMMVRRDDVPPEIKTTSEFSSVCPVSASVMVKQIR